MPRHALLMFVARRRLTAEDPMRIGEIREDDGKNDRDADADGDQGWSRARGLPDGESLRYRIGPEADPETQIGHPKQRDGEKVGQALAPMRIRAPDSEGKERSQQRHRREIEEIRQREPPQNNAWMRERGKDADDDDEQASDGESPWQRATR